MKQTIHGNPMTMETPNVPPYAHEVLHNGGAPWLDVAIHKDPHRLEFRQRRRGWYFPKPMGPPSNMLTLVYKP